MADLMDVCLQMLFSEGAGIVAVNWGGKKKDLISSKVGDFRASNFMRLQAGSWSRGSPAFWKPFCPTVSHMEVPPQ